MEKVVLTISKVIEDYEAGKYDNDHEHPTEKRLPEHYIFDENLSVKENRELVQQHNKRVEEALKEFVNKREELVLKLREDIKNALICEHNLTEQQAELIENFAYQEFHSCIPDYLNYLKDLVDLVTKLIATAK